MVGGGGADYVRTKTDFIFIDLGRIVGIRIDGCGVYFGRAV